MLPARGRGPPCSACVFILDNDPISVSVIDLYDGEQYSNLSKTHAYSNVRKLNG